MSTPSLAMIPSGRKAAKLYSVLPTDGTGDFTVVRNSTATYRNINGFIETALVNVPRFHYELNGTCPKLLTEKQSTNIATYSEQFDDASWGKNVGGISANASTSPDGNVTADKLVAISTNTQQWIYKLSLPVTSGNDYTASVFVKKEDYNYMQLRLITNINLGCVFNIDNGTIHSLSSGSAQIEEWVDGYYRISISGTATSTGNAEFYINLSTDGTTGQSFLGDDVSGNYIFGAMIENSIYPTSYIKTEATTTTRLKDEVNDAGDVNTFNSVEGNLLLETKLPVSAVDSNNWYTISDGTANNYVGIVFETTGKVNFRVKVGGVDEYFYSAIVDYSDNHIYELSWESGNFVSKIDDVVVDSQSSGNTFPASTLDVTDFGYVVSGNELFSLTNQVIIS